MVPGIYAKLKTINSPLLIITHLNSSVLEFSSIFDVQSPLAQSLKSDVLEEWLIRKF